MKTPDTNSKDQVQTELEINQETEVFTMLSEKLSDIPEAQMNADRLQKQLATRIQNSIARHAGLRTVRARHGVWKNLVSGIRYKPLWQSGFGNSVLIEFAPGASLPCHRHKYLEEGIVLSGSLQIDDEILHQYDYHISPAGSHHGKIWSKEGGLAFLRGSSVGETFLMVKEVLGGLLPKNELESSSIKSGDSEWIEIQPGLFRKELWTDGETTSQFYRLEPNTKIAGHPHPLDEECMMLSGDIFLGDILLQGGDYHLAPKGSEHLDIYTDTGALLYVRGASSNQN